MDIQFLAIWAVLKKIWADYEQLLKAVFSCFHGQNFFFKFFEKMWLNLFGHQAVRPKKNLLLKMPFFELTSDSLTTI